MEDIERYNFWYVENKPKKINKFKFLWKKLNSGIGFLRSVIYR
jgi:hypothetical protein